MQKNLSKSAILDPVTYERYLRQGWIVVEGVFDPREAEAISRLAIEVCESPEYQAATADDEDTADHSTDGQRVPRKLSAPFLKRPEFRHFVMNPRLRLIIEQLIGKPAKLAVDQILMKPPKVGSAKPYHQDNAYFMCEPADELITAWIALDDVDVSNGCLRYIDGSHREPILEHVPLRDEPHNKAPRAEQIDLARESLAPVKRGGVVFHHGHTLHTSHKNTSDRWRRGYATHWISGNVASSAGFVDRAYFQRYPDLYKEASAAAQ